MAVPIYDGETEQQLVDFRQWLYANGYKITLDPFDGRYSGSYITGVRRFIEFQEESGYQGKHRRK
jgi:hypothetical protein